MLKYGSLNTISCIIPYRKATGMTKLKNIEIFSDGACSGNPGPGGWGTILKYNGYIRELSGGEVMTTNNRMELKAVIEGLACLKEKCSVKIFTDSKYIVDGINKGWVMNWKNNGWIKSNKKPALNPDLWGDLLNELSRHECELFWLRGHNGHFENERCDAMAVEQAKKFSSL
jgi:ribonuclease HI